MVKSNKSKISVNSEKYTKIDLETMVDVCGGKMTAKELNEEIKNYMYWYQPNRIVIDIQRDDSIKGYRSTIYIPKETFERGMVNTVPIFPYDKNRK